MSEVTKQTQILGPSSWLETCYDSTPGVNGPPFSITYHCYTGPQRWFSYDIIAREAMVAAARGGNLKATLGPIQGLLTEQLSRYPLRVLSLDSLQEAIWDGTGSKGATAINEAVCIINKKLRPKGNLKKETRREAQVIHHVRGRGFTIKPHLTDAEVEYILHMPPGKALPFVLKTSTQAGELFSIPERNLAVSPLREGIIKLRYFEARLLEILQADPRWVFTRSALATALDTSKESISVGLSSLAKSLGATEARSHEAMRLIQHGTIAGVKGFTMSA